MNEILRLLFMQVKDQLDARYGCFEIFACDFLLKEDLSPVLMDITSSPSFSFEMDDSRPFLQCLLRDVINMSCDVHESRKTMASQQLIDRVFQCA